MHGPPVPCWQQASHFSGGGHVGTLVPAGVSQGSRWRARPSWHDLVSFGDIKFGDDVKRSDRLWSGCLHVATNEPGAGLAI